MRQRQLYLDQTVEGSRTQQVRGTSPFCQHGRMDVLSRYHHVDAPPPRARRRDTQLPPGPVPHQLVRERQRKVMEIPQRREGALDRGHRLGLRLVLQAARRIR
jgi:hypothetical protein